MSSAVAFLRAMRPHQWIKNAFVLAPLVFSRHLLSPGDGWRAIVAAGCFCLLSGAVYLYNDVRDVEADRAHPQKRRRPVAAGELSIRAALRGASMLAIVALLLAFWLEPWTGVAALAYGTLNLLYTVWLKHVAFVDVSCIAAGFVLRVWAGASAIAVPLTFFLGACTALLALLLGLGKRVHELAWADRAHSTATRASLAGYRVSSLRAALFVVSALTVAVYVAYTLAPNTVAYFGTRQLPLTAPFPALGIARFLRLALAPRGAESPTDRMLRDPVVLSSLLGWCITVYLVVYGR